jgi:light-regulated signal transduction histidine kinase (bacteriophytochrome)
METVKSSLANPAFGEADLTNCERELIHLAGSIQPHGAMLVLRGSDLVMQQASENTAQIFGIALDKILDRPAAQLGGNFTERLREVLQVLDADERRPLRFHIELGGTVRAYEGTIHRHPGHDLLIVEVELLSSVAGAGSDTTYSRLQDKIANAVHEFSSTLSVSALSTSVVACFREMAGYDRVMVYKFDPDGHGEIIAEARDEKLDSLLGHHYPATDIPQRARELYIRNRARVLVDTHYEPVPVLPRLIPGTSDELDMSLCYLRSMSPLHIQYLKNMGVTATLVVSLVREGRLWGLVACHHYAPKPVSYAVRAASELLGEVISTRIAALENYVQGQVDVMLRRLELRLIDATSTDGDWRAALFQQPRLLLQPLEATGVALVYDGEVMTTGEVPSTPDLRELARWIADQHVDSLYSCSSIGRANPALASLSPIASGVLAVKLSPTQPSFLIWFRPEQVSEVTWAGDPSKPMLDNDPLKLSPRRSFAAWSEIVRGSAVRWTKTDLVLARAIGASLAEFVLQVQVVRLLIAQHQLNQVQREVTDSADPVLIANDTGAVLYLNRSFRALLSAGDVEVAHLEDLANCFVELRSVRTIFHSLINNRRPWRGDLSVKNLDAPPLPVRMRADVVPGPNGAALGFIVILTDLTISRNAAEARRHFENAIADTQRAEELMEPGSRLLREPDEVISAILSNANLAALEITDAAAGASAVPLLEELEISTRRATSLYRQLRYYSRLN